MIRYAQKTKPAMGDCFAPNPCAAVAIKLTDLSGEWYSARGGLLSATAFYESSSRFIQTSGKGTETHNVTQYGVTAAKVFAIFQPVNAGKRSGERLRDQ